MNTIFIDLGGHHFTGDDLLKMQDDYDKMLNAVVSMVGKPNLILSGVQTSFSLGVITWTAGWVYFNGELFEVPAGSFSPTSSYGFSVITGVDSAGTQIYEDLNTVNTYKKRQAVLTDSSPTVLMSNMRRLSEFLLPDKTQWWGFGTVAHGAWGSTGVFSFNAGFRFNQIGDLVFRGSVVVGSYNNSTDSIVMSFPWLTTVGGILLPTGPVDDIWFNVEATVNSVRTTKQMVLHTNGNFEVLGCTNGQTIVLWLDTIVIQNQAG
jgi:hypothetical protein